MVIRTTYLKFSGFLIALAVAAASLAFSPPARADETGTADEAIALTKQAIAAIKSDGPEKAYAALRDPSGPFMVKDLYVFCLDMNGVVLIHGRSPALAGRNMSEFKDSDGKLFNTEMIKVAKSGAGGWVDYKWANPTTKKIEPKSSYVEAVDDKSFCGVGIYKK